MPGILTRKFREVEEVDLFLNGGLISGADVIGGSEGNYGINGLIGLTLKFKQPGIITVTFVLSTDPKNPNPARLTYKDIKAQIESAIAPVSVRQFNRHLVLVETTPANGVTIDHTGTATALLGFDANTDTVGIVYGPISASPPCLQGMYSTNDNMHVVAVYQ